MAAAFVLAPQLTFAADDEAPQPMAGGVEQVIVSGRAEQRIGKAVAASEGAIAGADLSVRPILRTVELIEAIPACSPPSTRSAARRTSISWAASTSITAPISASPSTTCR